MDHNLSACEDKETALQEAEKFSNYIFRINKNEILDNCLIPCKQSGFTHNLRYYHSNAWLSHSLSNDDKKAFILVSLRFESFMVKEEIENYLYDTTSLLTGIGGNSGLLIGMSLLSLLLGTIRLAKRCCQKVSARLFQVT